MQTVEDVYKVASITLSPNVSAHIFGVSYEDNVSACRRRDARDYGSFKKFNDELMSQSKVFLDQAMENSIAVAISVKAPVDPKPEKEEEEDGFTTPTGLQFKIPPPVKCPPAPRRDSINRKSIDKRRRKSTGRRLTSVNAQDLNTVFTRTQT
ncbi:unnamed protein product [Eruca vesicaria subsp. sativa]|uniref:Uncharacterized protein n=1 Tax=Eruca vesicaria subsp. sativa TaxID=29727 RepID=A0ABC8L6J0_ERUVS|nr:unnamed protein product [Eruca vesicaria subsp. sativa]